MSKQLTRDEVIALARLARLKLSEDEIEQYRSELSKILGYVDQLGSVDTEDLEPTSQVTGLTNVMRADEVREQLATPEELLEITPDIQDRYIKVRRMI